MLTKEIYPAMYVYSGPSSDFLQDEVTQQALKPRRANEWSTYVTQKCAAIPLHHRGLPRVQLSSHGRRPTITRDAAMSVPGEHGPHRDNYIPIMRQFKTNHLVLQPRRVGHFIVSTKLLSFFGWLFNCSVPGCRVKDGVLTASSGAIT